jgi:hypothetical protein
MEEGACKMVMVQTVSESQISIEIDQMLIAADHHLVNMVSGKYRIHDIEVRNYPAGHIPRLI